MSPPTPYRYYNIELAILHCCNSDRRFSVGTLTFKGTNWLLYPDLNFWYYIAEIMTGHKWVSINTFIKKSFLLFNSYRTREHYDETRPSRNLLPQCSPCLYNFTWWAKHEGNNSRTYNRTFRGPLWINSIFLAPSCGIENHNRFGFRSWGGHETKVMKLGKKNLTSFKFRKIDFLGW